MVGPRKRQRQRCIMVSDDRWDAGYEFAEARGISISEFIRRSMDEAMGRTEVRCNRGHESLRALWNCPVCTDAILSAVRVGNLDEAKRLSDELEKT